MHRASRAFRFGLQHRPHRVCGGITAIAALLALRGGAFAQEDVDEGVTLGEIVVTATRTETPVVEVGSSVTVITSEEIDRSLNSTVAEMLSEVPAIDVVRTGSYGSATSVFIRGARPGHTLVLIDGIELSNPIGIGRSPDINHLTLDNVERIEVVRGPQSTLYGSDALGGVVNVITKTGDGPPGGSFAFEGGSHSSFGEAVTARGRLNTFDYSISLSRLDTDGISSADEAFGNTEDDGYSNTTFSSSFGFAPSIGKHLRLLVRYVDTETEIDDGGGAGADDPDRVNLAQQFVVGAKAKLGLPDDRWRHSVGLSVTDFYRDDIDPAESTSYFDGQMLKGDWQGAFEVNEANTLTIGVEHEIERGVSTWQSESDAQTTALFIQDHAELTEGLFATLAARTDVHSEFGLHATGHAAFSYSPAASGARISATLGTGFRAPSLNQLAYNPALEPEESVAFDIGVEQQFRDGDLVLGATFFRNDFDNMIKWDIPSTNYANVRVAESEGVEIVSSIKTEKGLSVTASYTYTNATEDAGPAIRRPRNKASLRIGYRTRRGFDIGLSAAYVGDTDDTDFGTGLPVVLPSYTLVGVRASARINEKFEIFGRVDNLFDEEYETAYGYGTPGLTFHLGTKASF